jgi:glutamine synthetase
MGESKAARGSGSPKHDYAPRQPTETILHALERDHEFLLQGDVFTRDLLATWIEYKRERELDAVRLRPVPYEFFLYYDT